MVEGDEKFIYNSWMKSFKNSFYAGTIPNDLYFDLYTQVLTRILSNEDTEVLVACDPRAEKIIWGYIVCESGFTRPALHWIYVKQPFRGFGVASLLVQSSIISGKQSFYTFRVGDCKALCAKGSLLENCRYNQSLIRRKKNVEIRSSGIQQGDSGREGLSVQSEQGGESSRSEISEN